MKIIKKTDTKTSVWSGGTTTELAICPEGAVYADRDFLWRLSTAEVLDEYSRFTSLPDYYRFLTTRKGSLRIRHDGGDWYDLTPGKVTEFDGGSLTESEGRVTDFNLMLRKGTSDGRIFSVSADAGDSVPVRELFSGYGPLAADVTLGIFVSEGEAEISDGSCLLSTGEMILFTEDETDDMVILPKSGLMIIGIIIHIKES